MTRNFHKTIALTLLLALLLSGCEKYEMPGQDDDSEHSENTSTGKDNEDDGDNSYSEQYDEDDPYQGWGSLDNQINKGGTISRPYRAKDLATGKLGEWIVSYGVESMPNCWIEGYTFFKRLLRDSSNKLYLEVGPAKFLLVVCE